jgi:hypothetical protein
MLYGFPKKTIEAVALGVSIEYATESNEQGGLKGT